RQRRSGKMLAMIRAIFGAKRVVTATVTAIALASPCVEKWEGLRTTAYRDIVGIPTICFGETKGVKMGDTATAQECRAMLAGRLAGFEQRLIACSPAYSGLPPKAQAALISWSYNVGSRAACHSTLMRKAAAGDLTGMCDELLRWNRAGGRVVQGLVNRRNEEWQMCMEAV
ncbi:MAG: lysozyme, partial [Methyloligellaceae bacterium]